MSVSPPPAIADPSFDRWLFGFYKSIVTSSSGSSSPIGNITVPQGGTGTSGLTGYIKGNGTNPYSSVNQIPYSDISGTPNLNNYLTQFSSASLINFIQSGTGAVSRDAQSKERDIVSVLDFAANGVSGVAVDPTGVVDSTLGILAAEASLSAGQILDFGPGTFKFTSALSSTRSRAAWRGAGGNQTILLYSGASTTIDLVTFGDGTTGVPGVNLTGFAIRSSTTMTAGTALRIRKCNEAYIDVVLQGQTGLAAFGNKLWNGAWFNLVDTVTYGTKNETVVAQNDGIMVNGGLGGVGYKADLRLLWPRIQNCAVGIRCGGAFGGLYLINPSMTTNGINFLIDQTLTAETNREIFDVSGIYDLTTSGASIKFAAADFALFQGTGTWIASSASHGMHITSTFAGKVMLTGPKIYNNTGDGLRLDSASATVLITGGGIHNNGAYGINPNVASYILTYTGCYMAANATADVNVTNSPSSSSFGLSNDSQFSNIRATAANSNTSVAQLTNTGVNGCGWKMTGDGGTTPSKYVRVSGGVLQGLNSAYSALTFTCSDTGNWTFGTAAGNDTSNLTLMPATTTLSSLRIPHGTAPTTPVNGDVWTTTTGLFVRVNGATVGPLT